MKRPSAGGGALGPLIVNVPREEVQSVLASGYLGGVEPDSFKVARLKLEAINKSAY